MADTAWRDRLPAMLRDTFTGPEGEPCFTTTDRRWLWRVEYALSDLSPAGGPLRQFWLDLRAYLTESCEHHWREYAADEVFDAFRRCIWCNEVEVTDGGEGRG